MSTSNAATTSDASEITIETVAELLGGKDLTVQADWWARRADALRDSAINHSVQALESQKQRAAQREQLQDTLTSLDEQDARDREHLETIKAELARAEETAAQLASQAPAPTGE